MLVYVVATTLAVLFTYLSVVYDRALKDAPLRSRHVYLKAKVDMWQKLTLHVFRIASVLPLVFVAGFRYKVGTDWGTYVLSFQSVRNGNRGYYAERGYILVQKLVALVTSNYIWLFLLCALIFAGFYFVGIYKMSINPPLSVTLLVGTSLFFSFMNGMRQGLALAILFFSLQYVFRRDWKRFLIFLILASSFHTSSIAFAAVYILYGLKIDIKRIIMYTFIFGSVGLMGGQLVKFVLMKTKYAHYYTSIFANEGFELIWFLISATILIVMCCYYESGQQSELHEQFNLFLWMQMISVILCLISTSIPGANRVVWMFNIGQLVSLPILISLEKDKRWRFILLVLIVGFYILATFIAIRRGSHRVLPYHMGFGIG